MNNDKALIDTKAKIETVLDLSGLSNADSHAVLFYVLLKNSELNKMEFIKLLIKGTEQYYNYIEEVKNAGA